MGDAATKRKARIQKRNDIDSPVPGYEGGGTTGPEAGEPVSSEVSEDKKSRKVLTIPLNDDGTANLEGMRDSTNEKLRKALGVESISATPTFSVEDVSFLYDGLGGIESWFFVKFFGVPQDLANVFLYTPQDKEALGPPTAKLAAKYLPAMYKYKDEAALVMALYAIHQAKLNFVKGEIAKRVATGAPAPAPAPLAAAAAAGE